MTTEESPKKGIISILFSFFEPHKRLFFLDMGCALTVALIDLAYPLVSRMAMYELLPDHAYRAFFIVIAVMVAAYLLRTFLQFVFCYWGHIFGVRVEADIREALYLHMQKLGFDFYGENRTGQLMSRLTTDLFEVAELSHHGPEDLLISFATIIGALVVMFRIEWRLALVLSILIPLFLVVVMSRRRAMFRASNQVKRRTATIYADIESGISGIRTAKAFTNEALELQKFRCANDAYKKARRGFYWEMSLFLSVLEFFLCILSVAVIAVGGYLIMTGELNYIDLITFSLYITAFINPIRKLSSFSELFAAGFSGLQRFAELMHREPSIEDAPEAKTLENAHGEIELDHVSFAYEEKLDVLRDVDLHISAGETVAIVGPSGGGKTTICQLIPRFYDVTQGRILVDGEDVRTLTQQSLRQSIGIVQQDVFLFADTIFENIRYGKPGASRAAVEEAARRAEIYEDILALPNGFDTYVGERGIRLSGGQKQRIAIARIFLKNPPILILDEATSALDSVTEQRVQRAFDQLSIGRTTLIIAHRLSTIRAADRILVVADGMVKEQGSHEELRRKNGIYQALYETQAGEQT